MSPPRKTLLQVPQGTEGLYLNEAYIHNQVTHAINSIFHSWGYLPIETPVFDFYDIYHNCMDKAARDRSYRLVDRDGDLLMLRSDITLFLAKQIGLAISKTRLPARICYSDTILRHENSEDISRNEFFQIGAELVGMGTLEGELEIILLLQAVIDLLGVDVFVHIGSRRVFEKLFSAIGEDTGEQLRLHLSSRRFGEIAGILKARGYPSWKKVTEILQFIGPADEFHQLTEQLRGGNIVHQPVLKELLYLNTLCNSLQELGKTARVRVDLSEIGNQQYHTGTAFQVYMPGIDSSIASGGRYDGLLRQFGLDAESVGFSMLLRKVEPFLKNHRNFGAGDNIEKVRAKSFTEAFRKAEQLRKKGKTVVL
ncbi:MAG: ATP phosphoribosyltransferase regulatory subunit [Spirochaetales bacterium]|nr:ATP phosphoribosyltransferase regulatory subunit [Spirochaetales bacterium]